MCFRVGLSSLAHCPDYVADPACFKRGLAIVLHVSSTMLLLVMSKLNPLVILNLLYFPPSRLIDYFEHKWDDVQWRIKTQSKVVALTIDEVPSEYTEQILKILRDNEAHAACFVMGDHIDDPNAKHDQILTRLIEDGNELGNHAMKDERSLSLSKETLKRQMREVQNLIKGKYK